MGLGALVFLSSRLRASSRDDGCGLGHELITTGNAKYRLLVRRLGGAQLRFFVDTEIDDVCLWSSLTFKLANSNPVGNDVDIRPAS